MGLRQVGVDLGSGYELQQGHGHLGPLVFGQAMPSLVNDLVRLAFGPGHLVDEPVLAAMGEVVAAGK